jgi:phosphoserine aminotransferase
MPTRAEVSYFGAGPAPLPTPVLEAGAAAFLNFQNSGLSLAEISHRSPIATQVLNDTKAALAELLSIDTEKYEILFCHGGGSGEFSAVVFNMLAHWCERRRRAAVSEIGEGKDKDKEVVERVRREVREELRLDYLVTGSWSLKASQEAANLLEPLGSGFVNVACDGRKVSGGSGKVFKQIPKEEEWGLTARRMEGGKGSAFVYYCDNETVDGVEFPAFPSCLEKREGEGEEEERLVVADMSSNFLSRPVDVNKYAVIFVRIGPHYSLRTNMLT